MAKKEKKQKSKVSGLLLLLLLSIVMLATTTYAWFTANMNVKIDAINVQVKASGGLQISADAVNWKTILTNADITGYADGKNNLPAELEPVSSGLATSADGELKMFYGTVAADASGNYQLTSTALSDTKGTDGKYIVFDAFLKITAETADLRIDNGSGVVNQEGATNKGLQDAARIAFVKEGNVTAENYANAKNQKTAAATDGTNVYLWEPNFNHHSAYGVTNASNNYDLTLLASSLNDGVPYCGVSTAFANQDLKKAYQCDATTMSSKSQSITIPDTNTNTTAFTSGLVANGTNDTFTTTTTETHKTLFTLSKGITRVRIYMWIEGQDVDCNNDASGSDLTFNVNFSIPSV